MLTKKILVDEITTHLSVLQNYIEMQNANNCFDINKYCEDFFCEFLNILFDIRLRNLNELQMNFPAVDLGDYESGICFQVTSNTESRKIKDTLEKFMEKNLYETYNELNILILGKKPRYAFELPSLVGNFEFDINNNIIDFRDLLQNINAMRNIHKISEIRDFLALHIRHISSPHTESYLANIVSNDVILSHNSAFLGSVKYSV